MKLVDGLYLFFHVSADTITIIFILYVISDIKKNGSKFSKK